MNHLRDVSMPESEWPYPWDRDGLCYRCCIRCGIRMELPDTQLWAKHPREYCVDCDAPEFRLAPYGHGPFRDKNLSVAAA